MTTCTAHAAQRSACSAHVFLYITKSPDIVSRLAMEFLSSVNLQPSSVRRVHLNRAGASTREPRHDEGVWATVAPACMLPFTCCMAAECTAGHDHIAARGIHPWSQEARRARLSPASCSHAHANQRQRIEGCDDLRSKAMSLDLWCAHCLAIKLGRAPGASSQHVAVGHFESLNSCSSLVHTSSPCPRR